MTNNWKLYDELIEGIPSNIKVEDCIIGMHWTYLRTDDHVGIAMTMKGSSSTGLKNGSIIGKNLKDVAAGVKTVDHLLTVSINGNHGITSV